MKTYTLNSTTTQLHIAATTPIINLKTWNPYLVMKHKSNTNLKYVD